MHPLEFAELEDQVDDNAHGRESDIPQVGLAVGAMVGAVVAWQLTTAVIRNRRHNP